MTRKEFIGSLMALLVVPKMVKDEKRPPEYALKYAREIWKNNMPGTISIKPPHGWMSTVNRLVWENGNRFGRVILK